LPTDTERRLEQLENILLFGSGVAAGTASGRQLAAAAVRRAPAAGMAIARRYPVATAAAIAYVAYKQGLSIETATDLIEQQIELEMQQPQFFLQEQIKAEIREPGRTKRKISKANKAVKHAMSLLKAGSKRATGADKGKLPKGAFLLSVKASGLANPRTPSKIGKGKGKLKALARKIRSWW